MVMILIVEDDDFIRELSEMTIQDWGYQTLSAGDEDGALALLRSPQQIDALFTDIRLHKNLLGGCALALLAVAIRPQLRVLYTTGNFITDKMRDLFIGGADCLAKPYTPDKLHASLENMISA